MAYRDQVYWTSRVPETLRACQPLITCSAALQPLVAGYPEQARVRQRWLLVFSEEACQREVKTLRKAFQKQSLKAYKAFLALGKQAFAGEQDFLKALVKFIRQGGCLQLYPLSCEKRTTSSR